MYTAIIESITGGIHMKMIWQRKCRSEKRTIERGFGRIF